MKRSRFSEEQIIGILREQESGEKTADVCRRHGVSAELMRWMSPPRVPEGVSHAMTCVDAPCLASMIFDELAGSSIGRVSGL